MRRGVGALPEGLRAGLAVVFVVLLALLGALPGVADAGRHAPLAGLRRLEAVVD